MTIQTIKPFGQGRRKVLTAEEALRELAEETEGREQEAAASAREEREPAKETKQEFGTETTFQTGLDDLILYVGAFTKDGKPGCALTLLNPKTGQYEVLARENGAIFTAVPVSRKTFGHLLQ
jgi:hypothetical protein